MIFIKEKIKRVRKVSYKAKGLTITYRNDVIFKRLFASNDSESREILSFVLESVIKEGTEVDL